MLAWLSSHLSSAAAFLAAGAGDAYNLLFWWGWRTLDQITAPWVAGEES
jgi:hypothetical protein